RHEGRSARSTRFDSRAYGLTRSRRIRRDSITAIEQFCPQIGSPALLLNGQAPKAEAVFCTDLEQYPRSLFGFLKFRGPEQNFWMQWYARNSRTHGKTQMCK